MPHGVENRNETHAAKRTDSENTENECEKKREDIRSDRKRRMGTVAKPGMEELPEGHTPTHDSIVTTTGDVKDERVHVGAPKLEQHNEKDTRVGVSCRASS